MKKILLRPGLTIKSLDKSPQIGICEETPDFFAKKFSKDSQYIEDKLNLLNATFEKRPNYFEVDSVNTADMFLALSESIKCLQNYLTKSKEFLPDYKVKRSQTKITELSNTYDETRKRILPKKKFGFKARKKDAESSGKSEVDKNEEKETTKDHVKEEKKETKEEEEEEAASVCPQNVLWPERSRLEYLERKSLTVNTIENRKNEYIFREGRVLDNFDVNVVDLTNCFVELQGHITTLRISNVVDCVILAGPVKFSIYAENCRNTKLALSCQQLRLHESTLCSIFLHVSTRAIMEQCSNISYGKYNYDYPEINNDYEDFQIDRSVNNYEKIIDFNWLSTNAPSPNFKLLESNIKEDWHKLREEFQAKIVDSGEKAED